MKHFAIIHILLFILLLLTYQCASAQGDLLVTQAGDTLYGELKPMLYTPEKTIQVKTDDGKRNFSLLETKAYRLENEWHYPVKGPAGYTFMKLLKSGYLSLYSFRPENSNSFDGRFLKKVDGDGMEVPNLGFKKQMARYLSDCNDISTRIDAGELKRTDLDQILDAYNACIGAKTRRVKEEIAMNAQAGNKVTSLDDLEKQVAGTADFEGKSTALEMIADIKARVRRGEKVPNFITDGLKNTLRGQTTLTETLQKALSEINQ